MAGKYKNQEWEKRRGDFPLLEKLAKKHSAILEFIETIAGNQGAFESGNGTGDVVVGNPIVAGRECLLEH